MPDEKKETMRSGKKDRVLGDEWLNWVSSGGEEDLREGKRTFLLLSMIVMVIFVSLVFLFWYLVRPRFELYGKPYFVLLTIFLIALASFFFVWFILLMVAVLSRNNYLNVCLQRGNNFFS